MLYPTRAGFRAGQAPGSFASASALPHDGAVTALIDALCVFELFVVQNLTMEDASDRRTF